MTTLCLTDTNPPTVVFIGDFAECLETYDRDFSNRPCGVYKFKKGLQDYTFEKTLFKSGELKEPRGKEKIVNHKII